MVHVIFFVGMLLAMALGTWPLSTGVAVRSHRSTLNVEAVGTECS
jgi:hypothetical protein